MIDLTSALASMTKQEKEDECIKHAMAVRSAWSQSNYHRFFKLYQEAPKMSGYLMDWFVERERKRALTVVIKAYVEMATEPKHDQILLFYGLKLLIETILAFQLSRSLSIAISMGNKTESLNLIVIFSVIV